jgi:hypothetical protein
MPLALSLLPYLFQLASLAALLTMFFGISRRFEKLRMRLEKCEARFDNESSQISTGIHAMKDRIEDLEEGRPQAETTASVTSAGNAMNSTVRSKVLKMHRLGQSPVKIAETLRVPKGEVDLLIKVHRIVMRPYEDMATPASEGLGA